MSLEALLAISGFLLMLCVFTNKITDNFGIPSLLLFLGLGMLAGSDGPGGIEFNNSRLTNYIGTVALAFILFSGGLGTRWQQVRPILARGSLLSTVGVLLTAIFMYFFSYYILKLSFEISLLLSVIISSTDAPAVFSILRSHNLSVPGRLKAILEFESGSNDPMAVFLSMGAMAVISSGEWNLGSLTGDFLLQMFLGTALGMLSGYLASKTLRRWMFSYQGLYPVFGVALVLLTYSLTQMLGGNGFLAVYLCGIIMGNTGYMYRRHFIRFQESLVWIMQISMFLILGLLVFPHELSTVMPVSLACTLFLILVARPLAVFICLYRSGFSLPEQIFISWAGFKGAVPIILATYPLIYGFQNSQFLFNIIFFLVIISVLLQAQSLSFLAKRLHLHADENTPTPNQLNTTSPETAPAEEQSALSTSEPSI